MKPDKLRPNSLPDDLSLEFPSDEDVKPAWRRGNAECALEISAYYLPRFLSRPDYWKRRAEERCPAEFDLYHPERVPATYPAALLDKLFRRPA